MPTSLPPPSTIGMPEILYRAMRSRAARTGASGGSVTGSVIMPLWLRFTRSTSVTCSATERFRCTIPMPPCRAIAMARGASVTVSMAADTIGMLSWIFGVRCAAVLTSFGRTLDSAGSRRTSSKVSPSLANFGG